MCIASLALLHQLLCYASVPGPYLPCLALPCPYLIMLSFFACAYCSGISAMAMSVRTVDSGAPLLRALSSTRLYSTNLHTR